MNSKILCFKGLVIKSEEKKRVKRHQIPGTFNYFKDGHIVTGNTQVSTRGLQCVGAKIQGSLCMTYLN